MSDEKHLCPECETELVLIDGALPEKCAKCGFPLKQYQPFRRLLNAFTKEAKKAAPPDKKKSSGILGFLDEL